MTSSARHSTATRTGISSVRTTIDGNALTAPARLCFIVEERYEHDVMPGAVVDVLRSWGHHVDVLRPNGMLADLWDLIPTDSAKYDAFVLKTVSGGPGLSLLDAAGAAGVTTVNDYRAIRLARDKAVAAVRARAAGIPFPKTYFASRSALLEQIPANMYPLVVKPNNGSSCEQVLRVDSPAELAELDIDDSGCLLAQPYLPNPGYDVKLYNTGDEIFAAVRRSPLHPGAEVVEEQIPVTPELRSLARAVGRAFGLDIYGIDVVETADGWVVLDVNDFPSFGMVPEAATRLARTVLRVTRRAAKAAAASSGAAIAGTTITFAPVMEATA
jgi:ribosomal protein S6--L-glutamate ligase